MIVIFENLKDENKFQEKKISQERRDQGISIAKLKVMGFNS